jgi:4-amino-4-deoxy-L-arabinose transferase-like glycosyltransferase
MKNKSLFWLICFLALILRLWQIDKNPPSLNWDEVSHGYNAYSILKTGQDEWGVKFPLIFCAFGDYKLPLYIYLTVMPIIFLGLTPLSIRLISIVSGVGLVLVAYLIGKKLAKSQWVGLLSALLAAVSPWGLFLSRVAVEANLGAFLFALGVWFLLSNQHLLTAFLWGLTLHTYNSARLLAPLLTLIICWQLFRKKEVKKAASILVIFLLFLLPVINQFLSQSGTARFFWVSLIDQGAINRINEARVASTLPPLLARLIHNKGTYFMSHFLTNYISHFSPSFLFFSGGSHYQFSMPDFGLLFLVTAPFLLLGLLTNRHWFLFIWFFVAFVPSAITRDSPHVLRSILVLPLPMILTSLGLQKTNQYLKKKSLFGGKLLFTVFVLVVLISFGVWWRGYWQGYRLGYSWSWQYGYREIIDYVKENYDQYDKIFISKTRGEPHIFFLFYWPWDPKSYQTDPNLVRYFQSDWYWVDGFDKFVFLNDWEVIEKLKNSKTQKLKTLLITSPGNYPEGWKQIKTIDFLDGRTAFEILEK